MPAVGSTGALVLGGGTGAWTPDTPERPAPQTSSPARAHTPAQDAGGSAEALGRGVRAPPLPQLPPPGAGCHSEQDQGFSGTVPPCVIPLQLRPLVPTRPPLWGLGEQDPAAGPGAGCRGKPGDPRAAHSARFSCPRSWAPRRAGPRPGGWSPLDEAAWRLGCAAGGGRHRAGTAHGQFVLTGPAGPSCALALCPGPSSQPGLSPRPRQRCR